MPSIERAAPTRRSFVTFVMAVAGGFAVGLGSSLAQSRPRPGKRVRSSRVAHELDVWVKISGTGQVVVRVSRAEMGQGIETALAQLVAEELDCDWPMVRTEMVAPGRNLKRGRVWGEFATSNSRSIRVMHAVMREAGATARAMLLEAAAMRWNVPVTELTTEAGKVRHAPTGRVTTYGRLASAASKVAPPAKTKLPLKPPAEWRIAGKRMSVLGQRRKVTGEAVYGIDVHLPGMLSAAIRAAPVPGGTLETFDATAASAMPGVERVLVVGGDAVAVVARTWWQAKVALDSVSITWTPAVHAGITNESIASYLKTGLETTEAFVGRTHGDALEALRNSSQTVEAVYTTPFLHHAALEPMNATALWQADRLEVWAPTQNAEATLRAAAEAAGLAPEHVEIHRTSIGGGFGRRLKQDAVRQAVLIAREFAGTPVKLVWSREEDFTHGHYRPVTQARLRGSLDDKGEATGLILRISGQSILASNLPRAASTQTGRDPRMFQGLHAQPGEAQMGYSIPNIFIDHAMRNTHMPVGSWRGVHTTQNGIYLECFIDELAQAARRDPLDFRRSLMRGHPLHLAVLIAAATRANWGSPAEPDVHRGIAQMMAVGSYAAAVAEVMIPADGAPRVTRVVVALDCGTVVNPQIVEAQIQGSVVMATSAVLGEEITIRAGQVVERNFDDYSVLRLADAPVVECVLVPSGEFWGGVGGAAMGAVAPAILNAIFAATGKRVRSLPLKGRRLK
jgi:isoquinoline 1-oxidoreductase beta subunit